MFNISQSTGRRITGWGFWAGFLAGAWHVIHGFYHPFGLIQPFAWGAVAAVPVAGVLALLKRY